MYEYFKTDAGKKYFVGSDGKLHVELAKCAHCGSENVLSENASSLICVDCAKRRAYYYTQVHTVSDSSRLSTLYKFLDNIKFYEELTDSGVVYKVPSGVSEQRKVVEALIEVAKLRTPVPQKLDKAKECKDCGCIVDTGVSYGKSVRCPSCAERYDRYRYLQRHCGTLSLEECYELVGYIKLYRTYALNGNRPPNPYSTAKRVNDRLEALGADRVNTYPSIIRR